MSLSSTCNASPALHSYACSLPIQHAVLTCSSTGFCLYSSKGMGLGVTLAVHCYLWHTYDADLFGVQLRLCRAG